MIHISENANANSNVQSQVSKDAKTIGAAIFVCTLFLIILITAAPPAVVNVNVNVNVSVCSCPCCYGICEVTKAWKTTINGQPDGTFQMSAPEDWLSMQLLDNGGNLISSVTFVAANWTHTYTWSGLAQDLGPYTIQYAYSVTNPYTGQAVTGSGEEAADGGRLTNYISFLRPT